MSRWGIYFVIAAAILASASSSRAQFRTQQNGSATSEYLRDHAQEQGLSLNAVKGLLDPSRMKMSHSMSFGYANMGGTGVSRGLYMNRIDYQLARPLMLTTHLGYQFQPSGPAEWNPAATGNDFVGAADLTWQPSNNSLFRLSVARGMAPTNSWGYSPYGYSRYGYDSWLYPGRP